MLRKILPLAMAGAASLMGLAASAQPQIQTPLGPTPAPLSPNASTQTCKFDSGPRAGQTVNYARAPGAASVPIGSRCADMQGSSGSAVAQDTARAQSQGRYYFGGGAPNAWGSSGKLKQGYTQTCSFKSGPATGTSKDFSGTLGALPVSIGAPCSDGANSGVGVAPGK